MGLLELLAKLFGKSYLNKIMGTRTNVAKPIRMDNNSPFKKYSDDAFNDPKALDYIENKIDEYGPYALSNKNPQELANFEENAKRLLAAKNKQTGTTQGMVIMSDLLKMTDDNLNALAKEGNDLKAKRILTGDDRERLSYIDNILEEAQKLPNTGKGLAEDIKAAGGKPEAEIIDIGTGKKIDDEGIMSLKERAPQINTKASANLKEDIAKLTEREARAYSANIESFRRPIIRQMLLKDTKIKLPDDVRKSLENKMDLDKGADPEMDPLRLLNKYYDVDFNKLDELEEIRFTARNETEAADEFLQKGGLEPKKTKTVEEFIDDGDFDPGGMANGGRIGFAGGGIKALIAMMNKKFGKDAVKTADDIAQPDFAKLKKEFEAFQERNPDVELPFANRDKRIIPEGLTEEDVDFAILKGEFERKYSKLIPEDLMKKIMADDDPQRVKEIIGHVEQAAIMTDKGMSADQVIDAFKTGEKRKDNADGGLNYLMGL